MSADETPQPNNAASANDAPHPETYREGKLDVCPADITVESIPGGGCYIIP